MDYTEALNFIISRQSLGVKPGLSRIKKALDGLDNPQDKIKIIHIAGTNGKGTAANTIAKALKNNGLKVGLFTSPWVVDYCEQIQINGKLIPRDDFASIITMLKDNGIGADCTEFELLTVCMYYYFYNQGVDYAVVECGMGGKGDATNVEKSNACSVLTSISIDHTDFLGDTLEKIISEKEGIIRPNSPCFRYEDTNDFNNDNLELAKKVIRYLGYDDNIELSKPIARQQKIGNILLDGGHNLDAGKALAPIINDEIAIIGMMKDKDIDGYLSFVAPRCKKIICTSVNNPRAISADELASIASKYCDNVDINPNPRDAVKTEGVTLICGSFYLIREIIDLIS